MANLIQIKNTDLSGPPPVSNRGELTYSFTDGILRIGDVLGTGFVTIGGAGYLNQAVLTTSAVTHDSLTLSSVTTSLALSGNLTMSAGKLIDGRDISVDGASLDAINTLVNQSVTTTSAPTFSSLTLQTGDLNVNTGNIILSTTGATVDGRNLTADGVIIDRLDPLVGQAVLASSSVSFAAVSVPSITGLNDPTIATDAANKRYVDQMAQGLDFKDSCVVATTSNIILSGIQTIDGILLSANDRVLVKNQTIASENGIYIVATGAWTRSVDANNNTNVTTGLLTYIETGNANSGSQYVLTTVAPIVVGTTILTFGVFTQNVTFTANGGLVLTGSNFSIDPTWLGQTSITTVGTITTGNWNATAIPVAKGGTGLTAVINGVVKGDGTTYSAAVDGTDYLSPTAIIDGGTYVGA